MKFLRVALTGVYAILTALGVVGILRGTFPVYMALLAIAFFFTALSLNGNGGKIYRYTAFFTGGLLSLFLLASLFFAFNLPQDGFMFTFFLICGLMGAGTIACLTIERKLLI